MTTRASPLLDMLNETLVQPPYKKMTLAWAYFSRAWQAQQQRKIICRAEAQLQQLPDYILRDLGLEGADIRRVVRYGRVDL